MKYPCCVDLLTEKGASNSATVHILSPCKTDKNYLATYIQDIEKENYYKANIFIGKQTDKVWTQRLKLTEAGTISVAKNEGPHEIMWSITLACSTL